MPTHCKIRALPTTTAQAATESFFPFFKLPVDLQRMIMHMLSPYQAWVFLTISKQSSALASEHALLTDYIQLYNFEIESDLPKKYHTRLYFKDIYDVLLKGADRYKRDFIHQILRQDVAEVTLQLQRENIRSTLNTEPLPLLFAAKTGNIAILYLLLKAGALPNQSAESLAFTPLMATAKYGQTQAGKYLANDWHANLTIRDQYGLTALHYASLHGRLDWILFFLNENKLGCHAIFDQSDSRITPLHTAALSGQLNVVQTFIAAGYDFKAVDAKGRSLLDWCYATGAWQGDKFILPPSHIALAAYLNQLGLQAHVQHEPLAFWAIDTDKFPIFKMICHKNVDLNRVYNTTYSDTKNLLVYAVTALKEPAIISYLLAWGMDVNLREGQFKKTALFAAASEGHNAIIDLLINHGANINIICGDEWTPLMVACFSHKHVNCVRTLLLHGADINYCSPSLDSALHIATASNNVPAVTCLLEHGINIDLKNKSGQKAIDIANIAQQKDCYLLLDQAEKRFIPECIQLLDEQLLKPLATSQNNAADGLQRYQNAMALRAHIAALQRKDLTHREGFLLREFIKALVKPASDDTQRDYAEKIAALEKFARQVQHSPVWKTAGKILACIVITAAALITGAAIGMSVGFLAGAWAGPGAAMTSVLGLLQGLSNGFAIGTVATAALCGASTGGFTAWQFFKTKPAAKTIPLCEALIPGYRRA